MLFMLTVFFYKIYLFTSKNGSYCEPNSRKNTRLNYYIYLTFEKFSINKHRKFTDLKKKNKVTRLLNNALLYPVWAITKMH